jgi:hypothetical protein
MSHLAAVESAELDVTHTSAIAPTIIDNLVIIRYLPYIQLLPHPY